MTVCHKKWLIKKLLPLLLFLLPIYTAIAEPKEVVPLQPLAPELALRSDTYIPNPKLKPVAPSVLCNCWAYVKSQFPNLPSSQTILNNLSSKGTVAVFYYAEVGLYHYAVVLSENDTHYYIEETNYERCKKGSRLIPKDDPALLGFFPI